MCTSKKIGTTWDVLQEAHKVRKVPAFEGSVWRTILAILLKPWVNIVVWLNTV
jgi:hypothetical protein